MGPMSVIVIKNILLSIDLNSGKKFILLLSMTFSGTPHIDSLTVCRKKLVATVSKAFTMELIACGATGKCSLAHAIYINSF